MRIQTYVKVESLEEAYELNQKKSSAVLGGFTWLKMQDRPAQTAIDLSGLGLEEIEETAEEFRIGAMTPLRALETHPGLFAYTDGASRECVKHIVGVQFRNCATVGGSVFGRFGFSDVLTFFLAMDSYVQLFHRGVVSLADFAKEKADRDILVRVIVRKKPQRMAYESFRNEAVDFPVLAVCAAEREGKLYVSMGARPARAEAVVLLPQERERAAACFSYGSNLRASAGYREQLARVLCERAFRRLEAEGKS